jgi:type II secretory pathway component PulJ
MNRSDQGFALVEAVVALGIVAAIFGATFQTLAMARRAMAAAEERRVAMLEAQSVVAQLGATIPLIPGTSSGQSDNLHWRIDVDAVGSREIEAPLMHSIVTVTDEHGAVLARLETLRLAR